MPPLFIRRKIMELKTNHKSINLVFTTKKIVKISKILGNRNFEDLYFRVMNENDAEALAQIIFIFAEDESGLQSFKNMDEVYDFIDDFISENKKTYGDIYMEVAGAINDEGFFKKKMTKKEILDKISNPLLSINMTEIVKNSAERAIGKVVQEQIAQQA